MWVRPRACPRGELPSGAPLWYAPALLENIRLVPWGAPALPSNIRLGRKWLTMANALAYDNGTTHFKNVNNCLNTNIYSYSETSDGESSNLYQNVVHFFNTGVN